MVRRYLARILVIASLLLLIGAGVGLVAFQARGGRLLSIQSSSMAPNMQKGGLVGVMPVSETQLRVGDVITFINPADNKTTITHRVTALGGPAGESITTKGDANPAADAPISDALLIGRERFYLPWLGWFLDFVRQPIGLLLLIYVPALTVVVAEIRRLAAYYKSREPYVLPEFMARKKTGWSGGRAAALIGLVIVPAVALAVPARAALTSSATLSSTTISTAPAPKPVAPPQPKPESSAPKVDGTVSLRRVFTACGEGQPEVMSIHIVLYNSSRLAADVSGWKLRSGDRTVLTLPPDTAVQAHSTLDRQLPLPDNISYASGTLTLYNQDNEQISKITWEPHSRAERNCRTTSAREPSDEVAGDSRVSAEDRN